MAIGTFAPATAGTPASGTTPATPGTPAQYSFVPSQPIVFTDQNGGVHVQQVPASGQAVLATGIVPGNIQSPSALTVQTITMQTSASLGSAPVYSIPAGANLRSMFGLPSSVSTLYATATSSAFSATPALNPGMGSTTISGPLGLLAMGSRIGDGNIYYDSYDVSVQRSGTTIYSVTSVDLDSSAANSFAVALPQNPTGSAAATQPISAIYNGLVSAATLWAALLGGTAQNGFDPAALNPTTPGVAPSFVLHLKSGTDGALPLQADYAGSDASNFGLAALESIDEVSIVICPAAAADSVNHQAVVAAMSTHCTKMLYRVAVIDSPKGAAIQDVQNFKIPFSDTRLALY